MDTSSEAYIFEEMPIPRAVAKLAVPTVISQVVTMIYNLADTFFIGQLANPAMSAGVSLVSPYFNLLTALGNLFGLGGGGLPLFALAIAVSYRLSGYTGLYSEQEIVYSKTDPKEINKKAE